MTEWKETLLGECIEITHGYAFSSEFFSDTPTDQILLTPGNVKIGGGFNNSRFKYYNNNPVPDRYLLFPGDIVIALTDLSSKGDILGCAAQVPGMKEKKILHNQRLGRVRMLSKKLNRLFLYWLLRTGEYRHHVLSTATGTTVKHTAPRRIENYRFYLPPLEEQIAIATLLNAVEAKIHLLEQGIDILQAKAMTIFQHWFSDIQHSIPLSTFGKIVCGKTPSKRIKDYFGGPIPFVKIPDMRQQVFITRTDDSLTYKGAATQPGKQIPPHSICVSCIATIGLVAFTATWCHTNQQINTIIPLHHRNRCYLYCCLKTKTRYLEILGKGGTATLNINTGKFSQIPIPEPPQTLLDKFYRTTHPLFHRILLNTRQVEQLTAVRDSLLPWLMSGKLKIKAKDT
jgi:type I restriction enzyme S subunit